MPFPTPPADNDPIDHGDPLIAHTLRAALECYLRGDYHGALERLLDARAISQHRTDWIPINAWLEQLHACVSVGVLVTRDVPSPHSARRV